MRFLVVGAGALGGYFGGRLLEAGRDVTFLLRPRRAMELEKTGLVIRSRFGDAVLSAPPHVLAQDIQGPFDVVVVACKAYDLEAAMESFAPAVGPETAILPLLNGIRHLDRLAERLGDGKVLGGLCMISAALDQEGAVVHLNDFHTLAFGERDGSRSKRVEEIKAACAGAKFDARATDTILHEMWEKWVFIAAGAAITCLMRASVGDIVSAGAAQLTADLLEECGRIAVENGFPPRPAFIERVRGVLTEPGSLMTASMLKDIERGAPTEADHIIGDLLSRDTAPAGNLSLLRIAHAHLKAYDARRAREAPGRP